MHGAARALARAGRPDLATTTVVVSPGLAVRPQDEPGEAGAAEPVPVAWWIDGDRILLDGSADGTGRCVAHLAGRWRDRYALVAAARGGRQELAETGIDGPTRPD